MAHLEKHIDTLKSQVIARETALADTENRLRDLELQQEAADAAHATPRPPPQLPSMDVIHVSDVQLSGETPPLSDSDEECAAGHAAWPGKLTLEEAAVVVRHAPAIMVMLGRREHVQLVLYDNRTKCRRATHLLLAAGRIPSDVHAQLVACMLGHGAPLYTTPGEAPGVLDALQSYSTHKQRFMSVLMARLRGKMVRHAELAVEYRGLQEEWVAYNKGTYDMCVCTSSCVYIMGVC